MVVGSTATLASGLRLSYVERGEPTGPALVLLPGPTDSWRSYQPVLDRIPPGVRAVAVSQRGHGDSDKPGTGYRIEDFAADVIPLLDALGIGRAVLAGHSGSCLVARRVALDHPRRVAGLVLEASPTTLRHDPQLERFVERLVAGLDEPPSRDEARAFIADTSSAGLDAALVDQLVDELLKVPAPVWREMFAGLLVHDDTGELDRITVPVLLVWGDADTLVPRAMQEELVRRLARAELRTFPGAGHTPRWDEPARFAREVADFTRAAVGAGASAPDGR
jgi:non-heme chloroperoxidase